MNRIPASGRFLAALLCLLALAGYGCGASQSPKFYLLTSLSGMQQGARSTGALSTISVGVGPVTIPSYLDRPHIVTCANPPEIDLAEYRRWAEPLENAIPRILAEDLGRILGTEKVAVFPWPPANAVDYQVLVEVVRMDGALGDRAVLQTRWTILTQAGKRVYLKKNSSFSIPLKDASYESFVSAQSQALASLGEEIALEIKTASMQ